MRGVITSFSIAYIYTVGEDDKMHQSLKRSRPTRKETTVEIEEQGNVMREINQEMRQ